MAASALSLPSEVLLVLRAEASSFVAAGRDAAILLEETAELEALA